MNAVVLNDRVGSVVILDGADHGSTLEVTMLQSSGTATRITGLTFLAWDLVLRDYDSLAMTG